MRFRHDRLVAMCVLAIAEPASLRAQSLPPVHALGPVLATSTEPLAAVSQVRAISGGRVIVNDNLGRRVLMFDSTLQHVTIIADTTNVTGNAYSSFLGGLIAYRGDSTLFVDPRSVSMYVIDPTGRFVRTIAAPPGGAANDMIGGPFGTPALDAKDRLVFRVAVRNPPDAATGIRPPPDSAWIMRFNLGTRKLDTVVKLRIPVVQVLIATVMSNGRPMNVVDFVVDPVPWTDDWTVMSDGTIAVVRGREYRVDFIDGDGTKVSAPKLPFVWQRLADEDKTAILDSVRVSMDKARELLILKDSVRRADAGHPGPRNSFPPLQFVALHEMPDYRPAFRQGSVRGDEDGHIWIRTSNVSNGGPVYDVINRQGVLIDRVAVPTGRVVAGFGPGGVVYMGVLDGNIARLERARVANSAK